MEHKATSPHGLRAENEVAVTAIGQSKGSPQNGASPSITEPMARGKEAIGAAATGAMDSATSGLQSLQENLNDLKETAANYVSQAGGEAARSAADFASNVTGQVSDVAGDLAERGVNVASAATTKAKSFAGELERMTRGNQLAAIAGAVLIGALIGMLGRRR
jgi:ElaB/YqjD/DUF883 family membrane-anchored ribosome-binding protein